MSSMTLDYDDHNHHDHDDDHHQHLHALLRRREPTALQPRQPHRAGGGSGGGQGRDLREPPEPRGGGAARDSDPPVAAPGPRRGDAGAPDHGARAGGAAPLVRRQGAEAGARRHADLLPRLPGAPPHRPTPLPPQRAVPAYLDRGRGGRHHQRHGVPACALWPHLRPHPLP